MSISLLPFGKFRDRLYHIMARGDGGKAVFENDDDRKSFVFRLGQVCSSHGWRVHAWVLMGNHFHLLLETPQVNLVSGMQWLLGTFSQGWNRARLRRGHVFQGRYKSVLVTGTDADAYYFRIVADYIHLNPARAGLAGGGGRMSHGWKREPPTRGEKSTRRRCRRSGVGGILARKVQGKVSRIGC